MSVQPKILITRPREEAENFAKDVEIAGFFPVVAPLLEIVHLPVSLPDLDDYEALVFTSARGVNAYRALSDICTPVVYVVGYQTAEIAENRGFTDIRNANGTVSDLISLLERDQVRGLYLSRQDVAQPIDLPQIDTIPVYKADTVLEFDRHCLQDVVAVTFFSKRTAETFMRLIDKTVDLRSVCALCISESVADVIRSRTWKDVRVSECPNRNGMLDLLKGLA